MIVVGRDSFLEVCTNVAGREPFIIVVLVIIIIIVVVGEIDLQNTV